jgi:transposase
LQTDGCDSYDSALKNRSDIIHVGCWAHARRKFFEADVVSKEKTSAGHAMTQIAALYNIENELRQKLNENKITPEVFMENRKKRSTLILNAFHEWLSTKALDTLSSSKLAGAVNYTLGQWPKLIRYLDHIELTPDNNMSERSIKPFVIGRKNWILSGSPEGAKSSCELFSLIESAKANALNPHEYLRTIFEEAPQMQAGGNWSRLLPWNFKKSFPKSE